MTDIEDVYPPKDETDGLFLPLLLPGSAIHISSLQQLTIFLQSSTSPFSLFFFIIVDPPSSFRGSLSSFLDRLRKDPLQRESFDPAAAALFRLGGSRSC